MKKVFCTVLFTFILSNTVYADTPTNRAYGWDSFMNAPNVRFPGLLNSWGGAVGMGFNYEDGKEPGESAKEDYTIGFYMFRPQYESNKMTINLFYGFVFDAIGNHKRDEDTRYEYKIVLGFEPEYYLVKHFSLSLRTGLYLKFRDEDRLDQFDASLFCGKQNIYNGISFNWYN